MRRADRIQTQLRLFWTAINTAESIQRARAPGIDAAAVADRHLRDARSRAIQGLSSFDIEEVRLEYGRFVGIARPAESARALLAEVINANGM